MRLPKFIREYIGLWVGVFNGDNDLFEREELEFLGQKIALHIFKKKKLWDAILAVPDQSIMYLTADTFIVVHHIKQMASETTEGECCRLEGDCENCPQDECCYDECKEKAECGEGC